MGILYVLRSGIPWQMFPQELGCGSGMSCGRYLHAWQKQGAWRKIHELLLARLRAADKIDFPRAAVDSSSVRIAISQSERILKRFDHTGRGQEHALHGHTPCVPGKNLLEVLHGRSRRLRMRGGRLPL
jgi:transposase